MRRNIDGLPRKKILQIISNKGFEIVDQRRWTKVNGSIKRKLHFNIGSLVTDITLTSYRINHSLCRPVSREEATRGHLGRVRGWIKLVGDPVNVDKAVLMAVTALSDQNTGFDVI